MDANMKELEKKMGIKIERVRDMMLDRFCGVDQKLIAIEELLRKMMEVQNQNGTTPEKRCSLTGKSMGGGTEASKNKEKVKNVQEKTGLEGGSKKKKEGRSKDKVFGTVGLTEKRRDMAEQTPDQGGANDGPRSGGGLMTATRQPLDIFTSDEQEILADIESIMQSVRRIMSRTGYNDGDPLSADDQTYILENVFTHHPDKAQKAGAGVDYIMVTKNTDLQDYRCFFVVSTDGRKEYFSYRKCLENFVRRKYPDKVNEFSPKYFWKHQPCHSMNKDEAGTSRLSGGWNRDSSVVADEAGTPSSQSMWKSERSMAADKAAQPLSGWEKEASMAPKGGASAAGVDQNLMAIKDFPSKIMEVQNQVGNAPEKRFALTEKNKGKSMQEKTDLEGGWGHNKNQISGTDGSTEKGQDVAEPTLDQGGGCKKKESWCPKRDRPGTPVGGPSDGVRSGAGSFTATRQCLDMFTPDEQEILTDILSDTTEVELNQNDSNGGGLQEADSGCLGGKVDSFDMDDNLIAKGCPGTDFLLAKPVFEEGLDLDGWSKGSWTHLSQHDPEPSEPPVDQAETPKDSSMGSKAIQNEPNCKWVSAESDQGLGWSAPWAKKGGKMPQAQIVPEGSVEKGHGESHNPGLSGWKEEGRGLKRKHPDSSVGGPNDGPISSRLLTTSKRCLYMFTNDEQVILNEIETMKQSIRRVMYQKGYNDGEPLSAADQTYILDNVFNHHPEKAQKMGTGVDYVMISKHIEFEESRCFYIVATDGGKEDFCYHKCVWNFISKKYPDKLQDFISKYFEISEPWHPRNMDCGGTGGSGLVEFRPCSSWSGLDRETRVAADVAGPSSRWEVADDGVTPA